MILVMLMNRLIERTSRLRIWRPSPVCGVVIRQVFGLLHFNHGARVFHAMDALVELPSQPMMIGLSTDIHEI